MMEKRTLVLGASPNPARYSYRAVKSLLEHEHPTFAVGLRDSEIGGVKISKGMPEVRDIHTVALYIGPHNQPPYYDYIFSLHPRRIIFNPGTWNPELARLAAKNGIEVVDDCMLIMLNCNHY